MISVKYLFVLVLFPGGGLWVIGSGGLRLSCSALFHVGVYLGRTFQYSRYRGPRIRVFVLGHSVVLGGRVVFRLKWRCVASVLFSIGLVASIVMCVFSKSYSQVAAYFGFYFSYFMWFFRLGLPRLFVLFRRRYFGVFSWPTSTAGYSLFCFSRINSSFPMWLGHPSFFSSGTLVV